MNERNEAAPATAAGSTKLTADTRPSDETPIDVLARALATRAPASNGGRLEWIQTHISHVFLDAEQVYKLRKQVTLPFLDFGTREKRNTDCLDEIRLNRRLAPDVYLGLAPIETNGEGARFGALAEAIDDPSHEHVVVMRRLPEDRDLLSLIEHGRVPEHAIPAIAERLAQFHEANRLDPGETVDRDDWLAHCTQPAYECLPALRETGSAGEDRLRALDRRLRARFEAAAPGLEERRAAGLPVDGHGDLHLDHVWFESDTSPPLMIDCLEFDPALRRIDPASELAFLVMDLRYRGEPVLAEWLLAAYATQSDDYGLFPLVDVFAAYRALVRAKVAALAAHQGTIVEAQRDRARESALAHLDLAEAFLAPANGGGLVVLCGTVGTGKSTVGRALARDGEGVPIVSDRVRKRLAGLGPNASQAAPTDEGLYRPEVTAAVYDGLLERAGRVIAGGRTAILDASFTRRADRDRVRDWAAARDLRPRLLEVHCAEETARRRLAARQRQGQDPSDAGPEFLATSLARYEPPDEWPERDREIVWTDRTA